MKDTLNRTDLINDLIESLEEVSDSELAQVHNKVCSPTVEATPEGFAEVDVKKVDKDAYEHGLSRPNRVIAIFHVGYRVGDKSIKVREEYWDVTGLIEIMDAQQLEAIEDDSPGSSRLVRPFSLHEGPGWVEVEEQIEEYLKENCAVPVASGKTTNGQSANGQSANSQTTGHANGRC
jgi:hypothetical protein